MTWDLIKAKLFCDVVLPILCIVALIVIVFLIGFIQVAKDNKKEKLLFKHGFHAEEYVGFDNQHHTKYVRPDRTITEDEFNSSKYKELKAKLKLFEKEVK
jgi:uncharacterized membrane protein